MPFPPCWRAEEGRRTWLAFAGGDGRPFLRFPTLLCLLTFILPASVSTTTTCYLSRAGPLHSACSTTLPHCTPRVAFSCLPVICCYRTCILPFSVAPAFFRRILFGDITARRACWLCAIVRSFARLAVLTFAVFITEHTHCLWQVADGTTCAHAWRVAAATFCRSAGWCSSLLPWRLWRRVPGGAGLATKRKFPSLDSLLLSSPASISPPLRSWERIWFCSLTPFLPSFLFYLFLSAATPCLLHLLPHALPQPVVFCHLLPASFCSLLSLPACCFSRADGTLYNALAGAYRCCGGFHFRL